MSQPKLTLHHLESSQSLRMLWALEELAKEKGVKFDFKIYPRTYGPQPELTKLTGYATSPILTVEYPDGKTVHKTESRLLLDWLNQNVGGNIWTPASEEDRERDIFFQEYAKTTFELRVTFILLFEVVPQKSPWFIRPLMSLFYGPVAKYFKGDLARFIQPIEDALKEKDWLAGADIGISDYMMSFGMDMAVQRGYIDKQKWPKFYAWHERYTARECYKKALGEGGKYDLTY